MNLAKIIYRETSKFPPEEKFTLIQQMRRCSVSVLSNIAEGAARQGEKEAIQFFSIARGSISELDAQLELSEELKFIDKSDFINISFALETVDSLLNGLIRYRKNNLR